MLARSVFSRCKHCKVKFTPERVGQIVHVDCVEPYMAAQIAKRQAKQRKEQKVRAKVERAVTKARRRELETIPELIKAAQREFNKWVRTRDHDRPCISCGAPPPDLSGLHAGRDAGHYRSVGSASHLRFHEHNCNSQCVKCNQWGAGMAVDYRIRLIQRIGLEAVEALECDNTPHKWDREELREIRATYKAKLKELQKEQA